MIELLFLFAAFQLKIASNSDDDTQSCPINYNQN